MGTFIIIILVVYFIYYGANIVYDLFFRKEKSTEHDDDIQEFKIEEIAEDNKENVKSIGIDDVETLITPQEETNYNEEEDNGEVEVNMKQLQQKHEEEQQLEIFNKDKDEIIKKEKKKRKERFFELMKLAETNVQMVGDIQGQKIYESAMQF